MALDPILLQGRDDAVGSEICGLEHALEGLRRAEEAVEERRARPEVPEALPRKSKNDSKVT